MRIAYSQGQTKSPTPFVRYIENARVTSNSVVIKNWRVLKETIIYSDRFDYFNRPRFLFKYMLPSFPFAKKDRMYATIADEWCKNYCHWMFDAISKLVLIRESYPDVTVLLPEDYLKIEFIVKSLEAFGIKRQDILPIKRNSNVKVSKLAFVPCFNNEKGHSFSTPGYYDDVFRFPVIRETILNHYKDQLKVNLGERIYISRNNPKKNTVRKIANTEEVDALLEKYGFRTVYAENFSFVDQVSIANNAKYLISPHGAGITNAMFMKEGGVLLEMLAKKWPHDCFGEFVKRLGIGYIGQFCDAQNPKHLEGSDIFVDCEELEKNIKICLNQK